MLMLKTATVLEAISKRRRTARPAARTGLSKNTIFAATHSAEDALVLLDATANGLTAEQATERLDAAGPNTIEAPTKTLARRIADAFIDPFAGILAALALVSLYIDVLAVPEPQRDPSTVIVIGIMLLVSGGMKFIQEARSGNAADALKDLVSNTCTALRDDERIEILFDELVPGDVIRLSAGDMVPADARVITARDLFVIESALTGESEAVEKTAAITVVEGADGSALPLSACKNIVFTGTSVQNGTARRLSLPPARTPTWAASPRYSTGAAKRARLIAASRASPCCSYASCSLWRRPSLPSTPPPRATSSTRCCSPRAWAWASRRRCFPSS